MPGLSIKNALGVAALATVLIGFLAMKFFGGHDKALMKTLSRDAKVQETARVDRLLSAGKVIYDRCRTEYNIDEPTANFIGKGLAPWVSYALVKNYEQAYTTAYGAAPMADDAAIYQSAVLSQENDAAFSMERLIKMKGCRNRQVKQAYESVERYRQYYAEVQKEKK